MNIQFSAPSKTFLIGEYAVLRGGPALVLNTGPRFEFSAVRGARGVAGIPAGSPAAKWIEQRAPLLSDWQIQFRDPHEGLGGFGASSAQFLFVHALTTLLQISVSRAVEGLDLKALLNDFKVLVGGKASGADVLAQAVGQVAVVSDGAARAKGWPFPDLQFAILRTGGKVQTHLHLADLDLEPAQRLIEPAHHVTDAFAAGSAEKFVQAVREYAITLRELHWQAPSTVALLQRFEDQAWCKAVKGCGALGADTILVLYAREDSPEVERFFAAEKLVPIAHQESLTDGLEMKWSWA
jgi:mevalonate kinase